MPPASVFCSAQSRTMKRSPANTKELDLQSELREGMLPRSQVFALIKHHLCGYIAAAVMNTHSRIIFEGTVRSWRNFQLCIDNPARPAKRIQRYRVSPMNVLHRV